MRSCYQNYKMLHQSEIWDWKTVQPKKGHFFLADIKILFNKWNRHNKICYSEKFQHVQKKSHLDKQWEVNQRMFMKVNHQLQQLAFYLLCVSVILYSKRNVLSKEFLVRLLYWPLCIRRLNYQWTMKVKTIMPSVGVSRLQRQVRECAKKNSE